MSAHWRASDEEPAACGGSPGCCGPVSRPGLDSWDGLYRQMATRGLTITCMPFQDVWSLDLARLERCCGQVVTPDRRVIPFCANYLTSTRGDRLYSGRWSSISRLKIKKGVKQSRGDYLSGAVAP